MKEFRNKRTYKTQTFSLGNGESIKRIHSGNQFYENKLGLGDGEAGLRKIDNTLHWIDAPRRGWTFQFHNYQPFAPEYADEWFGYRDLFQGKDQTFAFRPRTAEHVLGRLENNQVIYDNAFGPGIDLIIAVNRHSMQKLVRIREGFYPATNQDFDFVLRFPEGVGVYEKLEDGSMDPLDPGTPRSLGPRSSIFIGNQSDNKREWFTQISPVTIWDSGVITGPGTGRKQGITPAFIAVVGGVTVLRKRVQASFFTGAVGDVYTDATVSYDTEQDTYYGSAFSPGPNNTSTTNAFGGWGDIYHSYMKFDAVQTSGISSGAVSDAKVYIYVSGPSVNDPVAHIRRVTSSWADTTLTRTNLPTEDATNRGSFPALNSSGWKAATVTSLVQDWLSGASSNFGVKVHSTVGSNQNNGSYSSLENADGNDPYIEITYLDPAEPLDIALSYTAGDFDIDLTPQVKRSITKGLVYRVVREITAITKGLTYEVAVTPLMETLTDDFDDNSLHAKWFNWGGAGTTETNNRLEIVNGISDTAYHGIDSDDFFDLTGSFAHIEVVNAGNQSLASLEVSLQVFSDSDNILFILITNNLIRAYRKVAGVTSQRSSTAYNSAVHKWIRIREASGTTHWEYSTDGLSWSSLHSESNPIAVTDMKAGVVVGTWQNEASATTVIFDNFNITPTTITKPLVYRVQYEHAAITKALVYRVTREISAITKGLVYRVSREISAITKGLVYEIQGTTEVGITKDLVYRVTSEHSITKGLVYRVRQPESITKALVYRVQREISAITKALVYRVRQPETLTKPLVYRIIVTQVRSQKVLNPYFSNAGAGGGDVFADWVEQPSGSSTITAETVDIVEGTKAVKMFVDASNSLISIRQTATFAVQPLTRYKLLMRTKSDTNGQLQYAISNDLSGSPEYLQDDGVTWNATINRFEINTTTQYQITELDFMTEAGQTSMVVREIKRTGDGGSQASRTFLIDKVEIFEYLPLRKTLTYRVVQPEAITKPSRYAVLREVGITKALVYRVRQPETITKGLIYRVSREIGITKGLVYRVIREIQAITKALVYKVTYEAPAIQKGLSYEVLSEHALTKGLVYRVATEHAIQKGLTYKVLSEGAITKAMAYMVMVERSITLPMAYEVKLQYVLTKPLAYHILSEHTITKGLEYRVRFKPYKPKPVNPYTPKPVSPFGAKQSPFTSKQTPYTDKGTSPYIPL